jgi:ABC-type antimicrobial peptide transport system permease subunit
MRAVFDDAALFEHEDNVGINNLRDAVRDDDCGALFFDGVEAVFYLLGWPTLVSTAAIIGSVIFSAAVGICFGDYPARKAAGLDSIEALRYE